MMAIFGGNKSGGKHGGKPSSESRTDQGTSFDQMTGEEKATEFDSSISDPAGYAERNFTSTGKSIFTGGKGKHRK